MASSQSESAERRPPASTTRSASICSPAVGDHPDVGDVAVGRLGGERAAHGDAAPDLDARLVGGDLGEGGLDHRPATGDLLEATRRRRAARGSIRGAARRSGWCAGRLGVEGAEQVRSSASATSRNRARRKHAEAGTG